MGRRVIKGLRAVFNGEKVLEDVEVLVENGRILDIGKNLKGKEVVYEGKVLYPKFADPHTHLIYAGDRIEEFKLKLEGIDYLEILKKGRRYILHRKKNYFRERRRDSGTNLKED